MSKELEKKLAQIIGTIIFERSQRNIDEMGITDRGTLKKSGNITKTADGVSIVYSVPYASYIEFGTAPHTVDPAELEGWAKRKLGDRNAAYAVAKKIEKEGTEPKPYFRNAIEQGISEFRSRYNNKKIKI